VAGERDRGRGKNDKSKIVGGKQAETSIKKIVDREGYKKGGGKLATSLIKSQTARKKRKGTCLRESVSPSENSRQEKPEKSKRVH